MKEFHSRLRARERFYIDDFEPRKVLSDIRNDKAVQIVEDLGKFSRTFLILYYNKYIRVVTDYNVSYVKTVLPLKYDYDYINVLISKQNLLVA